MSQTVLRTTLFLLVACMLPGYSIAQSCYRGRPTPTCDSFWITESFVVGDWVAGGVGDPNQPSWVAGAKVGWMRALDSQSAVGGSVGVSTRAVSLRPRYRRWLSSTVALDGEAAVYWEPGRIEIIGFDGGLMYRDLIGVTGGFEWDLGQGASGFHAGIQTGSYVGSATYIAAAGALLFFLLTYEGD